MIRALKIAAMSASVLFFVSACGGPVQEQAGNDPAPTPAERKDDLESMTAHSADRKMKSPPAATDDSATDSSGKKKWTRSGDPLDTSSYDKAIADAEKKLKASPDDPGAKKALSDAYFKRGYALTQARQYAAAIGDHRRALKYDPSNAQAQEYIQVIVSIYNSLNRDYPKEGEEPDPLPFEKDASL